MSTPPLGQLPSSLDNWLYFLANLHHQEIDLGLGRIGIVADRLGLRQLSGKVILIGGTNGKGTTAHFIESYLLALGFKVGVFNSPELIRYNERVRINGGELADKCHIDAFSHIEQHRGDTSLTSFEYSTLASFWLFEQQPLDYVIIEVGMGGRLDATNIVEPDMSVITTIDIDHQAFLGHDRDSIGYEKAGIFRPNGIAVVGAFDIPSTVNEFARQIDCRLICAKRDFTIEKQPQGWCWQHEQIKLDGLIDARMPMQNVATGLAVLAKLGIVLGAEQVNHCLDTLTLRGRFEQISDHPRVIVDVAHNRQSAAYLSQQLAPLRQNRVKGNVSEIVAVVGMLKDKEIEQVLGCVQGVIDRWYICQLDTPRAATVEVLAQALDKLPDNPYSCYDSVADGLAQASLNVADNGLVVVFGSFYTVAAALTIIDQE